MAQFTESEHSAPESSDRNCRWENRKAARQSCSLYFFYDIIIVAIGVGTRVGMSVGTN